MPYAVPKDDWVSIPEYWHVKYLGNREMQKLVFYHIRPTILLRTASHTMGMIEDLGVLRKIGGRNMMPSKKKDIDIAMLAKIAADVYHVEGNRSLQGCGDWRPWNLFGGRMHQGAQIGFYGRCYYSHSSKEIIAAIRGTSGTGGRSGAGGIVQNIADTAADFAADVVDFAPSWVVEASLLGRAGCLMFSQVGDAKEFVKKVQDYCAWEGTPYSFLGIVGRSLGGGLAAICALECSVQCVTFNPAPIDSFLHSKGRDFFGDAKTSQYVTNVISGNDFVSSLNNIVPRKLFGMPMEHSVPGYTLKLPGKGGHSIDELAMALQADRIGKKRPFL